MLEAIFVTVGTVLAIAVLFCAVYMCKIVWRVKVICPSAEWANFWLMESFLELHNEDRRGERVYTLALEEGFAYVGYSRNVAARLNAHFTERGSVWTRKFKPLRVTAVVKGTQDTEDEVTLAMMRKYGSGRVRGGKWARYDLRDCDPLPNDIQVYNGGVPSHYNILNRNEPLT